MWGQINKKTLKCSLGHFYQAKKKKFKPQQLTRNETKKKERGNVTCGRCQPHLPYD